MSNYLKFSQFDTDLLKKKLDDKFPFWPFRITGHPGKRIDLSDLNLMIFAFYCSWSAEDEWSK